jgi:hypothetical protein
VLEELKKGLEEEAKPRSMTKTTAAMTAMLTSTSIIDETRNGAAVHASTNTNTNTIITTASPTTHTTLLTAHAAHAKINQHVAHHHHAACVVIQCALRMHHARRLALGLAIRTYDRLIADGGDAAGMEYYYNIATDYSTWTKPKILGSYSLPILTQQTAPSVCCGQDQDQEHENEDNRGALVFSVV